MSASLAEDLSHLAVEFAPTTPVGPGPGDCTAPSAPTADGERDQAHSCIGGRPRLVDTTAQRAPRPPECPDVVATDSRGARYEGNLLYDILTYRGLRARQMEGAELHADDDAVMRQLESQLRPEAVTVRADGRATRQFLRWDTGVIEGVGLVPTRETHTVALPVDTVDLGAGGMCLVTELSLGAGDEITVCVDAYDDGRPAPILLPARVAWSKGRRVGLMFAGGPAWG
ncbi:MAG: PilZ domain-containing protein [Myxococcota bacterium]